MMLRSHGVTNPTDLIYLNYPFRTTEDNLIAGRDFHTAISFSSSLTCIQHQLAGDLSNNEDIWKGLLSILAYIVYHTLLPRLEHLY